MLTIYHSWNFENVIHGLGLLERTLVYICLHILWCFRIQCSSIVDELKHACQYCGKLFTRASKVIIHERIHTGNYRMRDVWGHEQCQSIPLLLITYIFIYCTGKGVRNDTCTVKPVNKDNSQEATNVVFVIKGVLWWQVHIHEKIIKLTEYSGLCRQYVSLDM